MFLKERYQNFMTLHKDLLKENPLGWGLESAFYHRHPRGLCEKDYIVDGKAKVLMNGSGVE